MLYAMLIGLTGIAIICIYIIKTLKIGEIDKIKPYLTTEFDAKNRYDKISTCNICGDVINVKKWSDARVCAACGGNGEKIESLN